MEIFKKVGALLSIAAIRYCYKRLNTVVMKGSSRIKNFAGLYEKYYMDQYNKGKHGASGPS